MSVKELSISFSAPMVLALLRGRKSQTRRLLHDVLHDNNKNNECNFNDLKVGDLLWLKEEMVCGHLDRFDKVAIYKTDRALVKCNYNPVEWSSDFDSNSVLYTPRHLSRITLEIKGIKTHELQNMSHDDCIREGFCVDDLGIYFLEDASGKKLFSKYSPIQSFWSFWDSLNNQNPTTTNPKVIAISFQAHLCNIDNFNK